MPDVNQPDSVMSVLADLQRRLEALETGQRAKRTSVRGGLLRVLDLDGNLVGEFGRRDDGQVGLYIYDDTGAQVVALGEIGAGEYGIDIASGGRSMLRADSTGGMSIPVFPLSWIGNPAEPVDGNGRKTTTSATFSALWRSHRAFAFGDQFGYNFNFVCAGGTTGDWQITCVEIGGSSPVVIASGAGLTGSSNALGIVTIPPSATISGTDAVLGRNFNFQLEMRRTAGAGTVAAAPIEQSRVYP
jgi:hypothetical protein